MSSDLVIFCLKNDSVPIDLKKIALNHIAGLITTEDGLQTILNHEAHLTSILTFFQNGADPELTELAHKCLINLSADKRGASALFSTDDNCIISIIHSLCSHPASFVDMKCKILANITTVDTICKTTAEYLSDNFEIFCTLVQLFNRGEREIQSSYNYLALFFGNLSRQSVGQRLILKDLTVLKSLAVYTIFVGSDVRRLGIAILLKNICFNIECHKVLLEEAELLPLLLLPLMGSEDYDEDEMEKLPIECQYLGAEQSREPYSQICIVFLEAFLKLCCTKYGRSYLRDNGVYYVLRELYKSEPVPAVAKTCEDVIEILIREEPDISCENFMQLKIPEDMVTKFDNLHLSSCDMPNIIS